MRISFNKIVLRARKHYTVFQRQQLRPTYLISIPLSYLESFNIWPSQRGRFMQSILSVRRSWLLT